MAEYSSTNPIVRRALYNSSAHNLPVAANAETMVKVTLDTVSFAQGRRSETRTMKVSEFDALLRRLGLAGDHYILRDIAAGGAKANIGSMMTAEAV